mmetsp:Transcript_14904/g.25478  ORF Transcript_14904/g.25478 Transcript_14904/m.25478 type:complete len:350 (+) Transcript_14904:69-1118(+)
MAFVAATVVGSLQSVRLGQSGTFCSRSSAAALTSARNAAFGFEVSRISFFGKSARFEASNLPVAVSFSVSAALTTPTAPATKADYLAVKKALEASLPDIAHDDGSRGPVLIRLAWHAAGTWDPHSKTGGSDGSTMRYAPEAQMGANAGLDIARDYLEPIKKQFPWITYADLWSLAGVVAVEAMGGPTIPWRAGRSDDPSPATCPPDGRLPDASKKSDHLRAIFGRMGFTDQEIVALSGAHAVGRCHTDRSGWDGIWTLTPIQFTNDYFENLSEKKWTLKNWAGPPQYEDPTGKLMMLPSDMALIEDPEMKQWVEVYAEDEELFRRHFATAFAKLQELGVEFPKWSFFVQ